MFAFIVSLTLLFLRAFPQSLSEARPLSFVFIHIQLQIIGVTEVLFSKGKGILTDTSNTR